MPTEHRELHFRIHGLDCAEEVAVLKREVGPAVGGEDRLAFDILRGQMTVVARTDEVTAEAVARSVAVTGMRAELLGDEAEQPRRETYWERRRRVILTATSGALALTGFAIHAVVAGGLRTALGAGEIAQARGVPLAARVSYLAAVAAGTWLVLPKAWFAVRRLRPDMNLLMVVAIAGAIAIDEWLEGATVAFLFALSLALEAWSVGRARRAVAALMELTPATVRVLRDGREEEVVPESVRTGTYFVVRPGDRIPLDGRVLNGSSHVNQAPITGESTPVEKQAGAPVYAGTINGDGVLEVESTRAARDTTLAQIIRMVGTAQSKRSPSEQWVERFARYYTPAVMVAALLVLFVPPLAVAGSWPTWVYRSLALLVIACPCALVISTPVSIVAAVAAAARQGVLIKGGVHVETPARLRAIAFDKTGTLTRGTPSVVEVVPLDDHDERELLERAAALEARSSHPLAAAIVTYAAEYGIDPAPAEDVQVIQGKGATARIGGQPYWIGSHRYLEERGQETPQVHERLEAMTAAGRTVVVVGNERHVCGLIALADAPRPHAREALEALRRAGVERLVMLTGDNQGTAQAVAREVGVDDVRAELLPQEKVAAVDELVRRYVSVGMVGDGVNDAPAMGRATLGVAMGAAGSDAAIESADIALMSDDLMKLPWLVQHSARALSIIRQNIAFSLAVKGAFVVLTFAGFASLWAAIAADTGATLVVIFNALRLLRTGGSAPRRADAPNAL